MIQFPQRGQDQQDHADHAEVDAEIEEHGRGQFELADQGQMHMAKAGGEEGRPKSQDPKPVAAAINTPQPISGWYRWLH